MPHLKDLLKKKDKISQEADVHHLGVPEFTFIRSTTESQEVIEPPTFPDDERRGDSREHKHALGFRNSSNASITKDPTATTTNALPVQQLTVRRRSERRLSERLHLHRRDRSRSGSAESSSNLPENLPEAPASVTVPALPTKGAERIKEIDNKRDREEREQREAQWEARATILAMNNPLREGRLETQQQQQQQPGSHEHDPQPLRSRSPSISDAAGDVNIQEAIRLHEAGDLARSTEMFGTLANPKGANNALAQVLYGLALRHGWGIEIDMERAIHFLSLAASNSASIEQQALASGSKKGGAAKGELVLAIFELANSYRYGWGLKKADPVAAREHYEAAANLGDTDAMDQVAQCYLEGFGGTKDKFKAAQYLRLAESKGSKNVGNSWIWKDKYNPK